MIGGWVASWLTDRIVPPKSGRKRTLGQVAATSLKRRAANYKPRNYARRKLRGLLR